MQPTDEVSSENIDFDLPASGTRCTDVLSDTLQGYAGIQAAEFDVHQGRLLVDYNPQILSDERALQLVRTAGERAYGRVQHCALKAERGEAACAACAAEMGRELAQHYRSVAQITTPFKSDFSAGRMQFELLSCPATDGETAQAEAVLVSPPAVAPKPHLGRERIELILTAVTAVTALLAYLGGAFDLLPTTGITILYAVAYLAGGYYGFLDGLAVLRDRRLDVNLLMIFAALGAALIEQPAEGAALLFLFSLSNTLQSYAMDRSRRAIEKLLDLRPATATVRRGSRLVSLSIEKLLLGDIVLVRPGERFPIDGEVITGNSSADQATITGESLPVEKGPGDNIFAGTVNGNGALEIRVTRLAQDTTLARIVQMVEDAQANKAQTQRMLDNFEQVYAWLVLGGALLLTVIPIAFLNSPFYPSFYRAMVWLVVASPCALVISTPASILSAIANGARRGVLFKGGVHLEQTATLKAIAFDKTGTLTTGTPTLNKIVPRNGYSENEILRLAAAVESRSEHPLAAALVQAAEQRNIALPVATEFQAITGQGVEANLDERSVWIGNRRLFHERRIAIPEDLLAAAKQLEEAGQTVMFVYVSGEWAGLIAVADSLRPDAAEIIAGLKSLGIEKVVMLTGDNETVAASIAARAGVNEFHASLLPQDKVRILKTLRQKYGVTAMVGDGVNDAPALATADIGIAMGGAGTDVALETADVVLMADDLAHLPYAIGLARQARRIVWQNLAFSLSVIVLLVVTAFGANLPLPLGVVGHEGSTVLVVLNGLRLLGYRR